MTVKQTENKQKDGRHKLTSAGPGRAKGSPNKFTNLKQAFLDVFEKIEKDSKKNNEIKSFFEWAVKNDKNRGLFYQMISKMLPSNVKFEGDKDKPLYVMTYRNGVKAEAKNDNQGN